MTADRYVTVAFTTQEVDALLATLHDAPAAYTELGTAKAKLMQAVSEPEHPNCGTEGCCKSC